jgi:hypothetical protein
MKLQKFELIKEIEGQPYSALMGWMLEELVDDWANKFKQMCPDIQLNMFPEIIESKPKQDPKWTEWMKYENHIERSIFRDLAEKNQIELKDGHNCNFIHVRGKMVGGVDYDTEVNLRLYSETSPALVFRRKGTNLMVMVYLHEWER